MRSYLSLITGISISLSFLWRDFLTKQKQQHYTVGRSKTTLSFLCLQIFHELLLLLEDVLQFSKRRLIFTLSRLVLGNPRVQFNNCVVKKNPLLDKNVTLLHPSVRNSLYFVKSLLQASNLCICISMCSHLLCCSLSSGKDLEVVDTVLVKSQNFFIESLDIIKRGRFAETFSSSLLSSSQPWVELLDTSSILSPVLDIIGVLVTLNLGVCLELSHILGDPVEFILEGLSISRNLVTLR